MNSETNLQFIPALRISTSSNCNFRCIFCPSNGDHSTEMQTINECKKRFIVNSINRFVDCGVRHFSLTGGEPLYNPKRTFFIAEYLKRLIDQERKIGNIDNYLRLNTNGVFVKYYKKELKSYFDLVKISLHSLNENMFYYLSNCLEKKKFYDIIEGIYELNEINVPMRLQFVTIRSNYREIPNIIKFCESFEFIKELKIFDLSEYSTLWATEKNGHAFWSEQYVSLEELEKIFKKKYSFIDNLCSVGGYGNPMNIYKTERGLLIRLRRSDVGAFYKSSCELTCKAYNYCQDGHCNINLGPNGLIKVCRPKEGITFQPGEENYSIEYFKELRFYKKNRDKYELSLYDLSI